MATPKTLLTIDVPQRGRKWVAGALVRNGNVLYRVVGRPVRYHEDCLARQQVRRVRIPPPDWTAALRLMEIADRVRLQGQHTPESRALPPDEAGEPFPPGGEVVTWEARQDAKSLAHYPELRAHDLGVCYVEPIYDDSPIVAWVYSAELAQEVKDLLGYNPKPSLCRYPRVQLHRIQLGER